VPLFEGGDLMTRGIGILLGLALAVLTPLIVVYAMLLP
jgi:hypothetical protein